MSKLTFAAATTAALLAGVAGASAQEAGGWVTSFDGNRLTLLDDPNVYTLGPSADPANIEAARTAYLTFDVIDGQRIVTGVIVPEHWYVEAPDDDDEDDENQS